MSNWNGKHYEGAMRDHRQELRDEAAERAKNVDIKRTRKYRLATPEQREAMEKASAGETA